ncbi:MAG: DUF4097 family beta strand repeat-containing protein [Longimicrobiales bacterium]
MIALTLLLSLAAPAQAVDTTVTLSRGDRVVIEGLSGAIVVTASSGDDLEVRSVTGTAPVEVRRTGASVLVGAEGARRRRSIDAAISVPAWVELEVRGAMLDLSVSGVDGSIRVENLGGDVTVRDVDGALDIRSIRGEILVVDARGGVRASSQTDDVTLRRVAGPVEVHSGDGDIVLEAIESESVRAETLDGDVTFSGAIEPGGTYGFFLHDGDAWIELPASVSARVSVSTFDGEFVSDFPVRLERFSGGREFDFVIGSGAALLEIEVFDGEIRLQQRP